MWRATLSKTCSPDARRGGPSILFPRVSDWRSCCAPVAERGCVEDQPQHEANFRSTSGGCCDWLSVPSRPFLAQEGQAAVFADATPLVLAKGRTGIKHPART